MSLCCRQTVASMMKQLPQETVRKVLSRMNAKSAATTNTPSQPIPKPQPGDRCQYCGATLTTKVRRVVGHWVQGVWCPVCKVEL